MIITYTARTINSASFTVSIKMIDTDETKNHSLSFNERLSNFIKALKEYQLNTISGNNDYTVTDSKLVKFYYSPVLFKQRIYDSLPYTYRETDIILHEAFACMGCKFHLENLQCFVEIKTWNDHIWAEVFYVANSLFPDVIIYEGHTTWFFNKGE
ncbi:hypothetical protein M0P65_05920 [Candidatus Gracilibacteria bacterium]|jgi:hypothetical protein|nr:hypothetical protein [Candidatus Gracilibacteria bacterium]